MIVTDRFVFLHLQKSGGSFINKILHECFPESRPVGYHYPYAKLPKIFSNLQVIGTVRNPWDYYVSWYFFQKQLPNSNYLFLQMSDNDTLDFESTIRNLISLSENQNSLDMIVSMSPDSYSDHGLNLTKNCFEQLRASGLGFYSFLYQRMYKGATNLHLIRMENLREEFKTFLIEKNYEISHPVFELIDSRPKVNTSRHNTYRDYYTKDLKKLVLSKDSLVVNGHDYSY